MKLKFGHSAPLEMGFCMASFFAEVKIFRFWLKTMDGLAKMEAIVCIYSFNSSLEGAIKLPFRSS